MPKQKDGRYRAKITVGHDVDGNPVYKYASGWTKRELETNKAELRQRYVDGIEDVKHDVLFGSYAIEWYEAYKQPLKTITPMNARRSGGFLSGRGDWI